MIHEWLFMWGGRYLDPEPAQTYINRTLVVLSPVRSLNVVA